MYREMMLDRAIKIMKGRVANIKNELIRGVSIDSRTVKPGELFFALKGENTDGHRYVNEAIKKGAIGVVVQRKTNISDEIIVNDTLSALGELARNYRNNFNIKIIAITGTNGKTTVKNLIAHILSMKFNILWTKKSYNSLIGLPLMVFKISGDEDYVILEMGTSNLGEIKRLCDISRPLIGVITNIGPGHLKGLGSIEGVKREKLVLLESLLENGLGFAGVGVDGIGKKNIIRFSMDDVEGIRISENGSTFVYKNNTFFTPLLGISNIYNCLCALVVTEKLGIDIGLQIEALRTIKPESGRMEPIRYNGLLIINDTYNANPLSMKSAIDFVSGLNRRKIFILGDMLELGERSKEYHKEIGEYARSHCDYLVTYGQEAVYYNGKYFDDKDRLVNHLLKDLKGNEVILIKASRAMRFEEILKKLLRRL